MCSLCRDGILGGGLYLDECSVTYRMQKLTGNEKYRNLVLPLKDIKEITWKWIIVPVATFHMRSGELYNMIIFNKRRFKKYYEQCHN